MKRAYKCLFVEGQWRQLQNGAQQCKGENQGTGRPLGLTWTDDKRELHADLLVH